MIPIEHDWRVWACPEHRVRLPPLTWCAIFYRWNDKQGLIREYGKRSFFKKTTVVSAVPKTHPKGYWHDFS